MAEVDHALKGKKSSSTTRSQASRKPRSKTGSKATKRAGTKARAKKVKESSGVEEDCKDGAKILREEANKKLAERSSAIASGLAAQAAKGSATCTKLLLDLSAGRKASIDKVLDGMYTVKDLETDVEWNGEREDGCGEIGEGGVERE